MGYIRITAGKFRLEDDNGNPAARGKVYTYTAGTSTAASSYSNKECTIANTNPIILDERGECELYTNTALKLIATDSTGTVIWTEDYQGEQQEEYIVSGNATGDTDNNYTMNVVPAFTAFPAVPLTIVMMPDTTNVDTLYSQSITGVTGINDLTWKGPYVGTTSGSIFSVQIDGVRFHGTAGVDLNDISWTGDLAGSVHTVQITTTGTPDKFKWRKDGGSWSAEINITGALQALDGDVSITFGATTGHTVDTYWNNKDTFAWKKDGGAWTFGVAIYPQIDIPQILQEGVGVIFASMTGHTLNDVWALTVRTPARLNFCSLGAKIIYKNVAGVLKALDGGDIVDGFPASLVYSTDQDCFILLNPSLPVLTALPRSVFRREIVADDTLMETDASNELAFIGTANATLTLLPVAENSGNIFDLVNASQYEWTVQTDPAYPTDLIITPENPLGVTSFTLGAGTRMSCRLESNGVNWHMPFDATVSTAPQVYTTNGSYTVPYGLSHIEVLLIGAGGGGGSAIDISGGGGGGGGGLLHFIITEPTDGEVITVTVGVGGTGGGGGAPGTAGGYSSFGSYGRANGGAAGLGTAGSYAGGLGADVYAAASVKVLGISCRKNWMASASATIDLTPPGSAVITMTSSMDGATGDFPLGGAGGVSGSGASGGAAGAVGSAYGGGGGGGNTVGGGGKAGGNGIVVVWSR